MCWQTAGGWQGFEKTFKAGLNRAINSVAMTTSAQIIAPPGRTIGCWCARVCLRRPLNLVFRCQCAVRFGCAQGKHRSYTLSKFVEDWVSRTICPAYHMPCGTAPTTSDAIAWFRGGLQWYDEAGVPGKSSRHAFSSLVCISSESCSIASC